MLQLSSLVALLVFTATCSLLISTAPAVFAVNDLLHFVELMNLFTYQVNSLISLVAHYLLQLSRFFSSSTYTASPVFAASTAPAAHAALQLFQLCQGLSPMSSCMLDCISFWKKTFANSQSEMIQQDVFEHIAVFEQHCVKGCIT